MRSKRLIALLGPTNTGKTHMAVERMLTFPTGMIGLPLRLLAREIYDRLVARIGRMQVALITGEEKVWPERARYYVCTVEAMPLSIPVDCMIIDEVQLAADFERGHVFTDRILHARGREETWLLGAEIMKPLLKSLLPDVEFRSRPRLSTLAYAGPKKLTRLPPRSAIVAFSAEMVYSVAELIRRTRGGAAVVMGALSPRTRNAQVALYQSGEVDYLVATDAIGMGLNMDIEHVAFAATRKFDGFRFRELTTPELGQIAGRAGRYLNDGTFGVTAHAEPFDEETVLALEEHRFPSVRHVQWRNRNLNFRSVKHLLASLMAMPNREGLMRAPTAADVAALELLTRNEEIMALADSAEAVELLWEACQLPDYRNITGADHAALIARIYHFLRSPAGVIDEDWLAKQVARCDRTDGDIDTLSNRIAHVRTWTFVANRGRWLKDATHWRERTREVEDRLSDALHERLTNRFIDRHTSVLLKKLRERDVLMSSVDDEGNVEVEGAHVGRIEGLRFVPDGAAQSGEHAKAWNAAAQKAVARELSDRAQAIMAAPDGDFTLDATGRVLWKEHAIGRLKPGAEILRPQAEVLADEALAGAERDMVQKRLEKFVSRHLQELLNPLFELSDDNEEEIRGLARGLAFRLVEALGVLPREEMAEEVKQLDQDMRAPLRKHGVRFGAYHIFIPALLKPAPTQLRLLLWKLWRERQGDELDDLPPPPANGLTSVPVDAGWPEGFALVAGYRPCGRRAVRVDMLERLGDMIRDRVFWKPRFTGEERPEGSVEGGGFTVIPDMMSLVGCSGGDFAAVLETLGYRPEHRKVKMEKPAKAGTGEKTAKDAAAEERAEATGAAEAEPASEEKPAAEPAEQTEAATPEASEAKEAEPEQAEPEEVEIVVWWPDGTGPFRKRKKGAMKGRRGPKPGKDAAAKGGRPPRKAKAAPRGKPRKEREPDPDSPFAVLAKLKQQD